MEFNLKIGAIVL